MRTIPAIVLEGANAVKPFKFRDSIYLGDPVNIVRILTDYDVEEIVIVDRTCTSPNLTLLGQIFGETLMPVTYGGGVRSVEEAVSVIKSGAEKIIVKSLLPDLEMIRKIVADLGSSAVAAAIDYRRSGSWIEVAAFGQRFLGHEFNEMLRQLESAGIGEFILTDMDREGTCNGLDTEIISFADRLVTPVLIQGGAGSFKDFDEANTLGFDGVVFSSLFCLTNGSHEMVAGLPKVIVSDPMRFACLKESEDDES